MLSFRSRTVLSMSLSTLISMSYFWISLPASFVNFSTVPAEVFVGIAIIYAVIFFFASFLFDVGNHSPYRKYLSAFRYTSPNDNKVRKRKHILCILRSTFCNIVLRDRLTASIRRLYILEHQDKPPSLLYKSKESPFA